MVVKMKLRYRIPIIKVFFWKRLTRKVQKHLDEMELDWTKVGAINTNGG